MLYLLDTSAVSLLMREDPGMDAWLRSLSASDGVVTCTITRGEILYGIERLSPGRRRTELELKSQKLFAAHPPREVPASAAEYYASIKAAQQRRGLSLDENDLWIAATALALGATLVSRDRDFGAIEALKLVSP